MNPSTDILLISALYEFKHNKSGLKYYCEKQNCLFAPSKNCDCEFIRWGKND